MMIKISLPCDKLCLCLTFTLHSMQTNILTDSCWFYVSQCFQSFNMVQIHDIQPVYCFLFNTTELLERSVSLSLLWEGVCQDVPVPLCVSLALLVRRPEHLGQDVGGAECGLHLPLCEIISLPPSVHLLAVRSETFQCEYIQITSFHSISPQSRSTLFSLIYSQNL